MTSTTDTNTLWQQRIDSWRDSGLKQSVWCRQNDVKASQFWYWKKKLFSTPAQILQNKVDEVKKTKEVTATAFVPVSVTPEVEASSTLKIALPNGLIVSGLDDSNIVLAGKLFEVLI